MFTSRKLDSSKLLICLLPLNPPKHRSQTSRSPPRMPLFATWLPHQDEILLLGMSDLVLPKCPMVRLVAGFTQGQDIVMVPFILR